MKIIKFVSSLLHPIFWCLLIFGFEEPCYAVATLICAVVHEIGHLAFAEKKKIRGVLSGFRIESSSMESYRQRILTYLGGPLANVLFFILCLALNPVFEGYFLLLGIFSLATAASNLLPIEGYDGYGILLSIIEMCELDEKFYRLLSCISHAMILCLCMLSLYLIDRRGGGYWIFAIFFALMIKGINRDISNRFSRF